METVYTLTLRFEKCEKQVFQQVIVCIFLNETSHMAAYIAYLDPENCSWCEIWYGGYQQLSPESQALFELKAPSKDEDPDITQIPAIRDLQSNNVMVGGAALQFLMKHMDKNTATQFKQELDKLIQAKRAAAAAAQAAPEQQGVVVAAGSGGWQNDMKQLLFGGSILKRSLIVLLLIGISVFVIGRVFGVSPLNKLAAALPGGSGAS